jgi:hypothetical protein
MSRLHVPPGSGHGNQKTSTAGAVAVGEHRTVVRSMVVAPRPRVFTNPGRRDGSGHYELVFRREWTGRSARS